MTTLMPGKFQFTYNLGNGDIRIYDVYENGQVQETVAKTNDVNWVSTDHALRYLDKMIDYRTKEKTQFRGVPIYGKTSKTKLDILLTIRRYMEDNFVGPEDIRYC